MANILIGSDFRIKVGDLGLSILNRGMMMGLTGTVPYIAPEILARKQYDALKADIFSLGVLLFCLVAGRPPF